MWTGRYTVGPQEYIATDPGRSGRTGSTVRVSVLWRRSIVAPITAQPASPPGRRSRQRASRRATRPLTVRGIRARMELRAGRFSTTSTGISALRSPDRSARRISSVSKRSCPKRQCRARGASASRRIAFTPWVSDTDSPKPTRSSEENTPVTSRRCQLRVSSEPAVRLEPTTTAGPSGASTIGHGPVEEAEIAEVDVEVHHHVADGGQEPGPQRPPVVGLRQRQRPQLGQLAGQAVGDGGGVVARPVLDDDDLERAAPFPQARWPPRAPLPPASRPRCGRGGRR